MNHDTLNAWIKPDGSVYPVAPGLHALAPQQVRRHGIRISSPEGRRTHVGVAWTTRRPTPSALSTARALLRGVGRATGVTLECPAGFVEAWPHANPDAVVRFLNKLRCSP